MNGIFPYGNGQQEMQQRFSHKTSTSWIQCSYACSRVTDTDYFSIPLGITKDNLIACECETEFWDSEEAENPTRWIHKYNFETNEWKKCHSGIALDDEWGLDMSALDAKQNTLYLVDENYLIQIDLCSNTITKHSLTETYHFSQCVILNNELYIIGGSKCRSISKWNAQTKQLTQISKIPDETIPRGFELTYMSYNNKTNCWLLFGGYGYNKVDSTSIVQYDVGKNEWSKSPVLLSKPMWEVCCLNVINDKYVLIFDEPSKDIHIYCTKTQRITKSKINCPTTGPFAAFTVNDKIKDEKIVFGFVRNAWNICRISDHLFPPFYLLKMMHSYYLNEMVYLIPKSSGRVYKMSTLDIV